MQKLCDQYIEAFAYSFGVVREKLLKKLDSQVDISNIDGLLLLVMREDCSTRTEVLQHFAATFGTIEYPLINDLPKLCMEFYERTGDRKFLKSLKSPLWTSDVFISLGIRCDHEAYSIFGRELDRALILTGLKRSSRSINDRRKAFDRLVTFGDTDDNRLLLRKTAAYEQEIRLRERYRFDYDSTDDRLFFDHMKSTLTKLR